MNVFFQTDKFFRLSGNFYHFYYREEMLIKLTEVFCMCPEEVHQDMPQPQIVKKEARISSLKGFEYSVYEQRIENSDCDQK